MLTYAAGSRWPLRFLEISEPRRAFIRQCQRIGFGIIVNLGVRDCDPVVVQQTEVLFDAKLDSDENLRPEQEVKDFLLTAEILRFFSKLDAIRNGTIGHVEIRAGLPRRVVFKAPDSMYR